MSNSQDLPLVLLGMTAGQPADHGEGSEVLKTCQTAAALSGAKDCLSLAKNSPHDFPASKTCDFRKHLRIGDWTWVMQGWCSFGVIAAVIHISEAMLPNDPVGAEGKRVKE